MIEFYPQIKSMHVAMVLASGGLFFLRGLLAWSGRVRIARHALLRYASYAIDTMLLTAAMMLLTFLPREMFANGWLLAKLLLLPCYVVLGVFALRDRGAGPNRACFIAAALVYAAMLGIARAHHPLGPLVLLQ